MYALYYVLPLTGRRFGANENHVEWRGLVNSAPSAELLRMMLNPLEGAVGWSRLPAVM